MRTSTIESTIPLFLGRSAWITVNRCLAWAMIASPLLQLVIHANLGVSVLIDLGLLAAHGVLSLVLFGVPKRRGRKFEAPMHLLGFRPAGLSPRNRFLLSGYRITLAFGALLLPLGLPPVAWLTLPGGAYMVLRLPITVMQHIFGGVNYAALRHGVRENAGLLASLVVTAYCVLSLFNLVRG